MHYYKVLLPLSLRDILSYSSEVPIEIGARVIAPVRNRPYVGIVLGVDEDALQNVSSGAFEYKPILKVLDSGESLFSSEYLSLLSKMSSYYGVGLGLVFRGVLSQALLETNADDAFDRRRKKVLATEDDVIDIASCDDNVASNNEYYYLSLSQSQVDIVEQIYSSSDQTHLIHGITGSGKTEIYIELARKCIADGGQVLFIVPEIVLTVQLIERFRSRLGCEVAEFNSSLTPKKRVQNFWKFVNNDVKILVGARSALFIPAKNLKLIIVDEEHDSSYKQPEAPSYILRDMAVMYSRLLKINVVLGSATPSIESYYNAKVGKYKYYRLIERPEGVAHPTIEIVDLNLDDKVNNIISLTVYDAIFEALQNDGQVVIYVHRKGYATSYSCNRCGQICHCPNCSVPLVYYKSSGRYECNYCGSTFKVIQCNSCGSLDFMELGVGTEKIIETLNEYFKNDLLQMDSTTISSNKKMQEAIELFRKKEKRIIIGTSLIAKGLNFPNVKLSVVLNIDSLLSYPDFRASERAYQILKQVAGRASRSETDAKIIVQTYMPQESLFQIVKQEIENPENEGLFLDRELENRKEWNLPPFNRIMRVIVSSNKNDLALTYAEKVYDTLSSIDELRELDVSYVHESPVFEIKNQYRYSIRIATNKIKLAMFAIKVINQIDYEKKERVNIFIDVDPHNFM